MMYSKYIDSERNRLKIYPRQIENDTKYYYLGVYDKNGTMITETMETPGSRIEEYFPLIVDCMNKRKDWSFVSSNDVMNVRQLDFCWTNLSSIDMKSSVHSRLMIDDVEHILSNKKAFYERFRKYDFVPKFISFTKKTLSYDKNFIDVYFKNMPIIIKPDGGSLGLGILLQNKYDFDEIEKHVQNSNFRTWTISTVHMPKIINGYIVTNRVYYLIVKENNRNVRGYIYNDFMNYRAQDKFTGDVTKKNEFVSNYIDNSNPQNAIDFIINRFIPHNDWMNILTKDEQSKIYNKLIDIFGIITDNIKETLLASNDNKEGNKISFHLYGVDVIIENDLSMKIIDVNGSPTINTHPEYYKVKNRFDNFGLMDDVLNLTVDKLYPSYVKPNNKFIQVYEGEVCHHEPVIYYIPYSIASNYPFIYKALDKRRYMRRTRNMYDDIDIFYGLRERYVTDDTNLNHYDELVNYKNSKLMRNAKIINKVQGVTYYLANKGRIHEKLKLYNVLFHPKSDICFYDNNDQKLYIQIHKLINDNVDISKWIIKPVHGSKGVGIRIFKRTKVGLLKYFINDDILTREMVRYIKKISTVGIDVKNTTISNFNGREMHEIRNIKYNYWIISQYISKPDLIFNKKYNIRFFVLLMINGKLPTYENLTNSKDTDIIEVYVFIDCMIYFAMLPYKDLFGVPKEYESLGSEMIYKMRNITNLEVVNEVCELLPHLDNEKLKMENTALLSILFKNNKQQVNNIMQQGMDIIKTTIEATKNDLRSLNRFTDNYKGSFNLLAYDTMLDRFGKLWFIEINRGPDMKGLLANIGDDGCTKLFDDIFSVTIDKHYPEYASIGNNNNNKYLRKISINYDSVNI